MLRRLHNVHDEFAVAAEKTRVTGRERERERERRFKIQNRKGLRDNEREEREREDGEQTIHTSTQRHNIYTYIKNPIPQNVNNLSTLSTLPLIASLSIVDIYSTCTGVIHMLLSSRGEQERKQYCILVLLYYL